jgi:glycosyltransferase involved in cell wall biosynthesis
MLVEGLVSTIIPVHNRATLLREAVNSVLVQSYRPIEIVVVDDGSTDATPQVAVDLQSDYPEEIRVIGTANGGPGAAREVGRRLARGEFIQYLDSDDLLSPDKFERQVSGLRQFPDCGISYGPTRYHEIGTIPSDTAWKRTGEAIETLLPSFLASRWWGTSTPLYRRALTDRGGAWTALRSEEDWEYDCRLGSYGVKLHFCRTFVSTERSHKGHRLSNGGATDAGKLADRAKAHELILGHARMANIPSSAPELQHFARELFLLARQCGAAGLANESERLFHLAREVSLSHRSVGLDFSLYEVGARAIGWTTMGRLACRLDHLRR